MTLVFNIENQKTKYLLESYDFLYDELFESLEDWQKDSLKMLLEIERELALREEI